MLISMTGHGQALLHDGPNQVSVEIRSVNNRFLKINVIGELSAEQSAEIDQRIRQSINRGTVTVRIDTDRAHDPNQFRINTVALHSYRSQFVEHFPEEPVPLAALIALPGIVEDQRMGEIGGLWDTVRGAVELALDRLNDMRRREGESMREALAQHLNELNQSLARVEARAPEVVHQYRTRLGDRLSQWLAEHGMAVTQVDMLREVGLFSERADIAEEIVRSRSHIQQCQRTLDQGEQGGRKLDFLTQEMLREANTIGSKSNDALISQQVVDMKTIIDRMRELVQNVE